MKHTTTTIDITGCAIIPLDEYERLKRNENTLNVESIKEVLRCMQKHECDTFQYQDTLIERVQGDKEVQRYIMDVTHLCGDL